VAMAVVMVSCNKSTDAKDFKTAYIDTNKLLEESTEAKDLKAKYEDIASEKDSRIKVEVDKLEAEKKSFEANAQKMVRLGRNKNMVSYNKENNKSNTLNSLLFSNFKVNMVLKWIL